MSQAWGILRSDTYCCYRFEFEKNSVLLQKQEVDFELEKARQFLKNKRLV